MIIIKINYASTLPNVNITYDQSNIYAKVVYGDGGGGTATWGLINGTLSDQTDLQNALNAKQDDITLTTIGNSGASTFVGNVLNIPQYTDQYVGTVTSVNMSVPTGLTISGNPITTSGTLAVGLQSGYSIPTTANQANWTTAYNDSIISAGVTGTTTKTLTLNQQDGGSVTASWTDDNTDAVTSVFGRTGAITAQSGDYTTTQVTEGTNLYYTDLRARAALSSSATGLTYNNTTGVFTLTSNYIIPTTTEQSNWTTAYNDSIISAAVTGTTTKTLTLNQQDGGTVTASWTDINTDAVTSVFGRTGAVIATEGDYTLTQLGDVTITTPTNGQVLKYNGSTWVNNSDSGLTSVGLSMPVAFSVANSPLTANGTLAVSAIGTASQYIRGDGQLATFPSGASGGSSVNYYLNGSVNQGTIGGSVYYEMNRNAVIGAGTDFIRTNLQGDGLIAQFITDANDPNRLEIPGGAWNFEMYFSSSSAGGTPGFYIELLKYDGTTFTSIANGSTNPEGITGGTSTDLYLTSLAVPQTTLLTTDRLAIRVYVITSGKDITLHTEDNNLCEIITTFAGGIAALNGLTANTQYLAVGTSGTDFAISSVSDTHTFNLPTASATNRGALSSTDWTTFNNKQNALTNPVTGTGTSGQVAYFNGTSSITSESALYWDATNDRLGLGTSSPGYDIQVKKSDATLAVSSSDGTSELRMNAQSGIAILETMTNTDLRIRTNSTERMRFTSGGNLLVGTTTDSGEKLVVSGTAKVTGAATFNNSVTASSIIKSGGTSTQYLMADGSTSTLTNPVTGTGTTNYLPKWTSGSALGDSAITDDGTNVTINGSAATYKLKIVNPLSGSLFQSGIEFIRTTVSGGSKIEAFRDAAIGGVGLSFQVTANNAAEISATYTQAMTLDASGNLGLGVVPSAWGSNYKAIQISSFSALAQGGNDTYIGNNWFNDGTNKYLQPSGASIFGQSNGSHFWLNAPSGTAGNAITFTQAMTLTSGGNLLVGTTTDSGEKLVVNGSILTGGASTIRSSSDFLIVQAATNLVLNANTGTMNFRTNSSDKMVLTNDGNLGLGVTPSAWVSGARVIDIGAYSSFFQDSDGYPQMSFNAYESASGVYRYKLNDLSTRYRQWNGNHQWFTAPSGTAGNAISFTQAMTLGANGRLLINTVSDAGDYILQANGYIASINSSAAGLFTISGTKSIRVQSFGGDWNYITSNGNPLVIRTEDNQSLYFYTNSSERIRITEGGNLLVGTTTDSGEKLQVSGTSQAISFKAYSATLGYVSTSYQSYSGATTWYVGAGNSTVSIQPFVIGRNANGNSPDITLDYTSGAATFASSVTAANFRLSALNTAPASASATGTLGEIRIDADYIYVCTATNTWKRVAIATW